MLNSKKIDLIEKELLLALRFPMTLENALHLIRITAETHQLSVGQKELLESRIHQKKILKKLEISWSSVPLKRHFVALEETPDPLLLATAMKPSSYIANESALYCLGLKSDIPTNIDLAKERPTRAKSESNNSLTNKILSEQFKNPPRLSHQTAKYLNRKFRFIERQATDNIGIISIQFLEKKILVSSLERTLIDLAISPHYSGGFHHVLKIYTELFEKIDLQKIESIYKKMNPIYPFCQRIGLLFKLSNNETLSKNWKTMFEHPKLNFYAERPSHPQWEFDEEWRMFYPK